MNLLDLLEPETHATMSNAQKFESFHAANPHVLETLERMTDELVRRGHKKLGVKMLVEVLRWDHMMFTNDPTSDFKVNNNYASYYARLLIERHPSWADVFNTRSTKDAQ